MSCIHWTLSLPPNYSVYLAIKYIYFLPIFGIFNFFWWMKKFWFCFWKCWYSINWSKYVSTCTLICSSMYISFHTTQIYNVITHVCLGYSSSRDRRDEQSEQVKKFIATYVDKLEKSSTKWVPVCLYTCSCIHMYVHITLIK